MPRRGTAKLATTAHARRVNAIATSLCAAVRHTQLSPVRRVLSNWLDVKASRSEWFHRPNPSPPSWVTAPWARQRSIVRPGCARRSERGRYALGVPWTPILVVLVALVSAAAVGVYLLARSAARTPISSEDVESGFALATARARRHGSDWIDGTLVIDADVVALVERGRTVWSGHREELSSQLIADPRPCIQLTGGSRISRLAEPVVLIVDRVEPAPVMVGGIGLLRQAAMARSVHRAIRESGMEAFEADATQEIGVQPDLDPDLGLRIRLSDPAEGGITHPEVGSEAESPPAPGSMPDPDRDETAELELADLDALPGGVDAEPGEDDLPEAVRDWSRRVIVGQGYDQGPWLVQGAEALRQPQN